MMEPGDSFDRYVIEGVLGEGGMGRVYRALDPRLGRRVALKVLVADGASPDVRKEAAARMMREARAAAAFSHPNVVAIHDVGEVDGAPYITMELVTGSTLRVRCADPSVSTETKLEWLIGVARGLAAAHRAGLVHRDIKPENVMVTAEGAVKILDFGIARSSEDASAVDANAATASPLASITTEGMMIGTPQYMAPEQLQATPLDGRADQFAWGVMAWELLAGKLPWGSGKMGAQIVAAVLATPVPPLGDVTPEIPPRVSESVSRALSKDRSQRFPTMDQLLVALGERGAMNTPPAAAALSIDTGAKAVTAATAATSTRPVARAAARGRAWIWVGAACVAACLVATGVFLKPKGGAAARSETRTASPDPGAGPVLGLCTDEVKSDCQRETTAWCDTNGRVVGCCGQGLVATGVDGICDCPPGGVLPDAGLPTCAIAQSSGIPNAGEVIGSLRPKLRACYNASLAAKPELTGQMRARLAVAPDGRVFNARFTEGRMPDRAVMSCVLDALRGAKFDPPAGGAASIDIPVGFVQHDSDASASRRATP
jgi:Protein kinase domain